MIEKYQKELLLEKARQAAENAYVPYSSFPVGAAVLCGEDEIFTGCNVENVSFGATMCAERVAVFKAISEGQMDLQAIAIYHNGKTLPFPCGMCLQVLAEFNRDIMVIIANEDTVETYALKDLLPKMFETDVL